MHTYTYMLHLILNYIVLCTNTNGHTHTYKHQCKRDEFVYICFSCTLCKFNLLKIFENVNKLNLTFGPYFMLASIPEDIG